MSEQRERERLLAELDERIAREPDASELLLMRAALLYLLGRDADAEEAYLDVVRRDPMHAGALNDLATLVLRRGFAGRAARLYARAVAAAPQDPSAYVHLGNLLLQDGNAARSRRYYEAALRIAPDHRGAHKGLAHALLDLGDEENARAHREAGYRGDAVVHRPFRGEGAPLRVLLLASASGGLFDADRFLDDRVFAVTQVVPEYLDGTAALATQHVVVNAIADPDRARDALDGAAKIARALGLPVVNAPERVAATGRLDVARRMAQVEGTVVPRIREYPKAVLREGGGTAATADGWSFPFLVRAPGHHTGRHFVMVGDAADLCGALDALPGDRVLVIAHHDVRGADGFVRKYRAIAVGCRLFPLHLAIAREWKVHWFSSLTPHEERFRREEAAFLADMEAALGARACAALERIAAELALDYAGIDFSLDGEGNVVLFEANAAMRIPRPDANPALAYRRSATEAIVRAVQRLIVDRAFGVR